MRKVGVLFLQSQAYFGSDSYIHSLVMRNLDRERFDVHVACAAGMREAPSASYLALSGVPDVNIRRTNFGPSVFALSARERLRSGVGGLPAIVDLPQLALYARRHNIRIVHGTEKPRDAIAATALGRIIHGKSIVHLHIKYQEGINLRSRVGIAGADAVIGVSEFVARSAIAGGRPADRVFAVLNALDASSWLPDAAARDRIRNEFGIAPCQPVVVIASRLFHWKGHRELIDAFALIRDRIPAARLLIVGDDDPRANDGRSFRVELEERTRHAGLADAVAFTGFRADVRAVLSAADVYAMPSFEEPCALAFFEAMAMGLPVVALDSGGAPEVIQDGCSGLLSAPGDIQSLADHLETLLSDPALRRRMGEKGRRQVVENFNPQRLARDVEAVYERVLARR